MSSMGKSVEKESKLVATRSGGKGEQAVTGCGFPCGIMKCFKTGYR